MQEITLLNAVTATSTSGAHNIAGFDAVTIQIIAANISSGNGKFEIEGSNDGSNWDALPVIRSLANANTQQLTRALSVTLSSNTNEMLALDPFYIPKFIRVKLTRTTDGAYTAVLHGHKRI